MTDAINKLPVHSSEVLYCSPTVNILQYKNGKIVKINPSWISQHFINFINVEHLTNITIRDDSHSYKINVVILTASSPKFKDLFVDKNNDYTKEIVLTNLHSNCLGHVLEFLYTGHLIITRETIKDILSICHQLELPMAVKQCIRFLRCYDITCALDFLTITFESQLLPVMTELALYIRRYGRLILENDNYLNLNADCVLSIVDAADRLTERNEDEHYILDKVIKWLQKDEEERKIHVNKLLPAIRWKQIPVAKISDIIDGNPSWFQSQEMDDVLYDAYRHQALNAVAEGYKPRVADWKNAPYF